MQNIITNELAYGSRRVRTMVDEKGLLFFCAYDLACCLKCPQYLATNPIFTMAPRSRKAKFSPEGVFIWAIHQSEVEKYFASMKNESSVANKNYKELVAWVNSLTINDVAGPIFDLKRGQALNYDTDEHGFVVFNNPEFGQVRVLIENSRSLFRLSDLCAPLGLEPKHVKDRLPDGSFVKRPIIDAKGRKQLAYFVDECGVYSFMTGSRNPIASKFLQWMSSEVISSLHDASKNTSHTNKKNCNPVVQYYQDKAPISFMVQENKVLVDATEMGKAFGKAPAHWLRNSRTKIFIEKLCALKGCEPSDLIKVINGDGGRTWMREDIAIEFARWLDPNLGVWFNEQVKGFAGVTSNLQVSDVTMDELFDSPRVTELAQEQTPTVFESPEFGSVRVKLHNETPMFCLEDVCRALGLTTRFVRQRIADGDATNYSVYDLIGRPRQATFINENGLYDVIFESRKPEARKFRKWVTGEVLPSIRKTGAYVAATTEDTPEVIMARGMMAAKEALERMEQRAIVAEGALHIAEPKAKYYDVVIEDRDYYTTTQLAGELGMSYLTLRNRLYNMGIITQKNGPIKLGDKFRSWGVMIQDLSPRKKKTLKWTKEGRKHVLAAINPLIPTISNP